MKSWKTRGWLVNLEIEIILHDDIQVDVVLVTDTTTAKPKNLEVTPLPKEAVGI